MKKTSIRAFIIIMFLLSAAIFGVIFNQIKNTIPDNPLGTLGNTPGNLNNHGLFCEYNGRVYFCNPTDNQYLYSMLPNHQDVRLEQTSPCEYINAAGDYIYFYQKDAGDNIIFGVAGHKHGIYALRIGDTNSARCYDRTASGIMSLIGSDLIYQKYDNKTGFTLSKTHINGTDKADILPEHINPACSENGRIIFPDENNRFYLSSLDISSGSITTMNSLRVYNPVLEDNSLYFMNVDDNYALYRYSFSEDTAYKLTNDRVDCFNVLGNIIFYQRNSATEPALIRMSTDGSSKEVVAIGNYTNINMTSSYTYFYNFDDESMAFVVPTAQGTDASLFIP